MDATLNEAVFNVKSPNPSREYRRYLKWNIERLYELKENNKQNKPLEYAIIEFTRKLKALDEFGDYWLEAIDSIITGSEETLAEDVKFWANCAVMKPQGVVRDIINFTERFEITKRYKEAIQEY